jgi:hypothetical protein
MSTVTFQPDIIVTGSDGVTLVVEAKASLPNLERTDEQLRKIKCSRCRSRYTHIRCGVIRTPVGHCNACVCADSLGPGSVFQPLDTSEARFCRCGGASVA